MKWEIRPIEESELLAYAAVQLSAYPASSGPAEALAERMRLLRQDDTTSCLYGAFAGGRLVGGMRLLDFQINYCGRFMPAGGVGSVAVDFTEKKQGMAKALIQHFIEHYRQNGAHLTLLYPFRPDFYQQMGYGFAPKMQQYCFLPASLPCPSRRHGLVYLTEADLPELRRFSDEYAATHHGFCRRSDFELRALLKQHAANRTLVGWLQQGQLQAYLAFNFRRESSFLKNSLIIKEWLWQGQEAFLHCCSFLHSQADQICQIVYNTVDDAFHYALADVRNGSERVIPHVYHESNTAGVGLMYRITGLTDFLAATDYRNYNNQSMNLRLSLTDSFLPENTGTYHLSVQDGRLQVVPELAQAVDLAISVSDLSSLLMGSVSLQRLYRLGRVQLAADRVAEVDRLFRVEQPPECITAF